MNIIFNHVKIKEKLTCPITWLLGIREQYQLAIKGGLAAGLGKHSHAL